MTGVLYIHADRASPNGTSADPQVRFVGKRPSRVICVRTASGMHYFIDSRDAHDLMQEETVQDVRMLPVLDE